MILTCPSCATSYFTPDEAIGPGGRSVRCKTCQHTWRATLDEPLELSESPPVVAKTVAPEPASFGKREDASPEPATPESLAETPAPELPKAYRAKVEQQRRLRRAATHGVVWAGIASGFALLLGAAWLFRVEVVEMMPRTAAAYAAVGLEVNPTGLDFEAVSGRALPNDPGKIVISGALRNVRDNERVAPPVRVALLDEHGAEIAHAIVRIDAAPVLPGKVQGFAAVVDDPGGKGRGVAADFVLTEAPAKAHAEEPHDATPVSDHGADHAQVPAHRPLPVADDGALRPALPSSEPLNMQPIDAVATTASTSALDNGHAGAVSAPHG
jgi:predicted Zn finger-like uncharacterized protein